MRFRGIKKRKTMKKKEAGIIISTSLFKKLIQYHVLKLENSSALEQEIEKELEAKLHKVVQHELYTQYKTAPTEEEREEAYIKYLNSFN